MSGPVTLGLETPVGRLDVILSETAIHRVGFGGKAADGPVPAAVAPLWKELRKQIGEYFEGRRGSFDLPLRPHPPGTPFQEAVWEALRRIPPGQVLSYADLAAWAGRKGAARAAGSACGANRIPLLIPCHRAVAKGGLGGFGGGLAVKKRLLRLERTWSGGGA
ncbi:MAG: methylated-DNA--[protein]-cysteine S-methyltransferase [Acidobacteriota bacterium]